MKAALFWMVLLTGSSFAIAGTKLKTLKSKGVNFHIAVAGNTLTITASTLGNKSVVTETLRGKVIGTKAEDLDADGNPEIYIFIRETEIEARGQVLAYATNRGKSLTPIQFSALTSRQAQDYKGHDEYAFVEGNFLRRFRIPDGKVRQIQYQLTRDTSGWMLTAKQTTEF